MQFPLVPGHQNIEMVHPRTYTMAGPSSVCSSCPVCFPRLLSLRECTTVSPVLGYRSTTSITPPAFTVVPNASGVSFI